MNIDSYDKFEEYVKSLNKGGFQGKFYLEKGVDNAFIWEYNEIFKFQIIFDWYDNFSEFTIIFISGVEPIIAKTKIIKYY